MHQVALVSGGSRGIGRAIVEELCRGGCSVIFLYRSAQTQAEALVQRMREAGLTCEGLRCDVADSGAVNEAVRYVLKHYGRIDLLVNNAAVSHISLFTDVTDDMWREIFSVNVDGAFYLSRAVLPGMISRKSGVIVNISSMWGQVGASCEVAYSATKAALIGMTKALAQEVGPSGIRVNCVCPGVIDTEMNAHLSPEDLAALADETPLCRIGTPEEVAKTVAFLAGEGAAFITGQVIGVNGGMVI